MLRFVSFALMLAMTAFAQVTESRLRKLYPVNESAQATFFVRPGVQIKALLGSHKEACVLIITGAVSEKEVFRIFAAVAPPKSRGVKKIDSFMCAGPCQRNIEYGTVAFTTGVTPAQTSNPAAIISFNTPDCKSASERARNTVLVTQKKSAP